jgi:hypothetical protein
MHYMMDPSSYRPCDKLYPRSHIQKRKPETDITRACQSRRQQAQGLRHPRLDPPSPIAPSSPSQPASPSSPSASWSAGLGSVGRLQKAASSRHRFRLDEHRGCAGGGALCGGLGQAAEGRGQLACDTHGWPENSPGRWGRNWRDKKGIEKKTNRSGPYMFARWELTKLLTTLTNWPLN